MLKILTLLSFLYLAVFPNWGNTLEMELNDHIGASYQFDFDRDGKVETQKSNNEGNLLLKKTFEKVFTVDHIKFNPTLNYLYSLDFHRINPFTLSFHPTIDRPPNS